MFRTTHTTPTSLQSVARYICKPLRHFADCMTYSQHACSCSRLCMSPALVTLLLISLWRGISRKQAVLWAGWSSSKICCAMIFVLLWGQLSLLLQVSPATVVAHVYYHTFHSFQWHTDLREPGCTQTTNWLFHWAYQEEDHSQQCVSKGACMQVGKGVRG